MSATMVIHEGKELEVNIAGVKNVKVESYLGSGAFADVWKVKDLATSKSYVLKHIRLKAEFTDKEKKQFIQRIKNEASVKIPSKYIVSCLGINEIIRENFFLLFEFILGQDFGNWLRDNKELPWESKKHIFLDILRGINDAHSMNIIHRDLKPDHILITAKNEPRIIDFGLAKLKDMSITDTGEFGPLSYMEPQILLSDMKYVDARCDVYAMGVTLYELVTGIHYWLVAGLEFGDFVRVVTSGKRNILEIEGVPELVDDPIVRDVIAKSTAFDPEQRTRTINDMIVQLGGESVKRPDIKVDFSITSPVLVVEDGSAKGSMNMITVADGGKRSLVRMNLDATNNTISKRNHAAIVRQINNYYLYDTGSKNGTYLNGSRVGVGEDNKVEIKHGDRIRFGDLWTRFVFLKK